MDGSYRRRGTDVTGQPVGRQPQPQADLDHVPTHNSLQPFGIFSSHPTLHQVHKEMTTECFLSQLTLFDVSLGNLRASINQTPWQWEGRCGYPIGFTFKSNIFEQ